MEVMLTVKTKRGRKRKQREKTAHREKKGEG